MTCFSSTLRQLLFQLLYIFLLSSPTSSLILTNTSKVMEPLLEVRSLINRNNKQKTTLSLEGVAILIQPGIPTHLDRVQQIDVLWNKRGNQ